MNEQSTTKTIAKNYTWLILGGLVSGGTNFITGAYIARILGAATFGWFRFAQAFQAYLILIVDSGLSTLGTKEIAQNKERAATLAYNLFVIRLIVAAVTFGLAALVVFLLPLSLEMRLLFLFSFLFIFNRALNAEWAFQGLEKMEYISIAKVLNAILFFVLVLALVRGEEGLLAVPFLQFASALVIAAIFLVVLFVGVFNRQHLNLAKEKWGTYLLQAAPLGASAVLVQVYNNLDTIMLGFMDQAAVVGYYNAAYQVYYIFLVVFILWQSTALPVVSRRINQDAASAQAFLGKYLRLTLLGIIPLVVLVFASAPLIIRLVFGAEYQPAATALRFLIWTMLPCAIGYTYGILLLIPAGRFKEFFYAVAAGALVNVILNFALIPSYSMYGAAMATIAAETTVAIVAYRLAQRIFRLPFLRQTLIPILIAIVAFSAFLVVSGLLPGSVMLKTVSGIAVYLIVGVVLIFALERKFIGSFVGEIIRRDGTN